MLSFEFLVLTAARSAEVRGATWDEIDLGAAVWTIRAQRMKAAREHRVPLSDRALAVLDEARRELPQAGDLVFPPQKGLMQGHHPAPHNPERRALVASATSSPQSCTMLTARPASRCLRR